MVTTCWSAPGTLAWRQDALVNPVFSLVADGQPACSLSIRGCVVPERVGQTGYGEFHIVPEGVFGRQFAVRAAVMHADIATCMLDWWGNGGAMTLHQGERFVWSRRSIWQDVYVLNNQRQETLFEIIIGRNSTARGLKDWCKTEARVRHDPRNHPPATLSLLAVLSWFSILQQRDAPGIMVYG